MSRVPLKRAWLALFKSVFNYGLLQAEDTLHSNKVDEIHEKIIKIVVLLLLCNVSSACNRP